MASAVRRPMRGRESRVLGCHSGTARLFSPYGRPLVLENDGEEKKEQRKAVPSPRPLVVDDVFSTCPHSMWAKLRQSGRGSDFLIRTPGGKEFKVPEQTVRVVNFFKNYFP